MIENKNSNNTKEICKKRIAPDNTRGFIALEDIEVDYSSFVKVSLSN